LTVPAPGIEPGPSSLMVNEGQRRATLPIRPCRQTDTLRGAIKEAAGIVGMKGTDGWIRGLRSSFIQNECRRPLWNKIFFIRMRRNMKKGKIARK
jgi:hypothetical protein